MNSTSAEGIQHIKDWEQLRLKAYKPHKDDVWTIGYGHTHRVYPGMEITQEQAESFLSEDLYHFESAVNDCVKVPINQKQFDALVSFSFNVGSSALRRSTLVRELNKGNYDAVPDQLRRWNKSAGRVMRGLVRRRASEAELWCSWSGEDHTEQIKLVDKPKGRSFKDLAGNSRTIKTGMGLGALSLGNVGSQLDEAQGIMDKTTRMLGVEPSFALSIIAIVLVGYVIYLRWSDSQNGRAY